MIIDPRELSKEALQLEKKGKIFESIQKYEQLLEADSLYADIAGFAIKRLLRRLDKESAANSDQYLNDPGLNNNSTKSSGLDAFNPLEYLALNPDLSCLSEWSPQALSPEFSRRLHNHFKDHGLIESRLHRLADQYNSTKPTETDYVAIKQYMYESSKKQLIDFLRDGSSIHIPFPIQTSNTTNATVVVVTRNKCPLTLKALRSVAKTKYVNVELIVVDNGSTDSTSEMLSRVTGNIKIIKNSQNLHFLKACNQAFDLATTGYICLLNNDALLDDECIFNAISTLNRRPQASIVGGMVMHLDGRIQDAGSIVFADGSCQGIGRRALPNKSIFGFERFVDFVSGCFLCTKTTTIRALSGFDEAFAPAYYEETDLCFRASELVGPVLYQPTCRVWHYEYGSSDLEDPSWPLFQMKKNRLSFAKKHAARLAEGDRHQRSDQYNTNHISSLMHGHVKPGPKILFIDDLLPAPDFGAGMGRAAEIINSLRVNSSFLTCYSTRKDNNYYDRLINCSDTYNFESASAQEVDMKTLLFERVGFYSHIFVSRRHNQENYLEALKHLPPETRVLYYLKTIFDCESLFSLREWSHEYLKSNNTPVKSYDFSDVSECVADEAKMFNHIYRLICVSNHEKEILTKAIKTSTPITVLGHKISEKPSSASKSRFDETSAIGFVGSFHDKRSPNHDTVSWMLDGLADRLNLIYNPPPPILIAGNATEPDSLDLLTRLTEKHPNVSYLGFIDNLDGFFSSLRVFIAPTRFAAGISIKILEAASHGIPIVTTDLIAFQMGISSLDLVKVASSEQDFAMAVHELYTNYDSWERYSLAAKDLSARLASFQDFEEGIAEVLR
jgi:O-antigen biosynthesis protein